MVGDKNLLHTLLKDFIRNDSLLNGFMYDVIHTQLHVKNTHNMVLRFKWFLTRLSVSARPYAFSAVKLEDHYPAVTGSVKNLNRDVDLLKFLTWDNLAARSNRDEFIFNDREHLVVALSDVLLE